MLPLRILPAALASATLDQILLSYTSGETRNLDSPNRAAPPAPHPATLMRKGKSNENPKFTRCLYRPGRLSSWGEPNMTEDPEKC